MWNLRQGFFPLFYLSCGLSITPRMVAANQSSEIRGFHVTICLINFVCIGPFTLAKTKIQKTWVFCCTVYTARKTHNILGFWHEKRMREKTRISYLCFGKWCACATSLYLWPYTCSAHYVAGRGRVIPLKVTYHVTKNPNNTGKIGASVYIGKKPVKFRRSFKKSRCGGGFFDSGFLECLGEVA